MSKKLNPFLKRTMGFFSVIFILVFIVLCFYESNVYTKPIDIQDDVNTKYTNIGNFALTITNYGTIGKGYCGSQPSGMFPVNSGIENFWLGGLWIGGIKNGQIHVTTGAIDVSNANKQEGFEFTNGSGSIITERSSLINSPYYSPNAISHQDFICEFFDTISTGMQNHTPMGVKVLLESYAYNLNFANYFVIFNYKIVNIGYNGDYSAIDSLYVGMWKDMVVRNINVTPGCNPGTSFFNKGANGYVDSLRLEYAYDHSGDVGFTDNYVSVKLLGANPRPPLDSLKSKFTIWGFKSASGDPAYFSPTTDQERYSKLKGFLTAGVVIDTNRINTLRLNPGNRVTLISYGPFKKTDGTPFTLRYQLDTLNVVFAVVCAKKNGTDPAKNDTEFQKKILFSNAAWAQRAYDNGYKLPSPPDIPIMRTEIESKKVTVWWSNNAENSVDPVSGKKDFEGYRIYRTNPGFESSQGSDLVALLKLIGDFDSCCNAYSNNTGFKFVKYSDTNPKTFTGDTNKYWYRFEFPNQLNGFQYIYSVSAYDKGDPSQGVESLESSILYNIKRVIVGTPADNTGKEIGVYPNPYYGSAIWDGTGTKKEVLRKIYFYNLPSKCTISIWTLSGDLVKVLNHDASTYNGMDIEWFKTYTDGTQKLSGGEHAWDLISKENQAIATGLYLFTVKDESTGDIKKGKFLIVK